MRGLRGVVGLLLVTLLLAGCGGPQIPAGAIQVTMTEYKYAPSSITAPAGKVVFELINSGAQAHDMAVLDSSGKQVANSDLVSAGDTSVFTIDNLPAGQYTFHCTQAGHQAAGMSGTLTVT